MGEAGESTYRAKVLHETRNILNDTLRAALARQEAIYGAPMKISNIRLAPLADDPREVYEVFVEFEPAAPAAM